MTTYHHRFDFDIGYLIKSPCKNCGMRQGFPKCSEKCEVIDKIQEMLCGVVSSSKRFSSMESFSVSSDNSEKK